MNKTRFYILQIIFTVMGILTSLYLFIQHIRLKSGIQDSASICNIGSYFNCDIVAASSYSEFLGIPVAAIGMVFFFILLIGLILARPKCESFKSIQSKIIWLCLIGLAYDLFLAAIQIFILKAVCLFCYVTYILNFGIFILSLYLCRSEKNESLFLILTQQCFNFKFPKIERTKLVLASLCLITFIVSTFTLPANIWIKSQFYAFVNQAVEQYFQNWSKRNIENIPIEAHNGSFGNKNSRIKVIEFSDFECPFCKKAAFTFHTLMKSMPNKIEFIFKHYPLDPNCNNSVKSDMHPMACQLAYLSYCAKQKNKFWEFHDAIFLDQETKEHPSWEDLKSKIASILNEQEIEACLKNPQAVAAIAKDIEIGNKLNLQGTPTLFINGKIVDQIPITVDTLKTLIRLESEGF